MNVSNTRVCFARLLAGRATHTLARRGLRAVERVAIVVAATICLVLLLAGSAFAQTTTRVSVSSAGVQGNNTSHLPSISADGRYVAFNSDASNLVTGDTNNASDVFVYDRQTGATTRVSVSGAGVQGIGHSYAPSISADGRYVAFNSDASNLVTGDTNNASDVFVYDRQTGTTTRVSVSSTGVQGDDESEYPSISADGRYVAFFSDASNLVTGDTNNASDVFVYDRQTATTTRVSASSTGAEGDGGSVYPSISADGRYVAFHSYASNLVTGDTNGASDAFVYDRQTGATTRVSVSSLGVQGNDMSYCPSISADGRYVAFYSRASNLVVSDTNNTYDTFVYDRQTGTTTRVSVSSTGVQGNGYSYAPSISADGRYVAFNSYASNLVTGDTNGARDAFEYDRQNGTTTRVSVSSSGDQGNGYSFSSSISADGSHVAFLSDASNLVTGDTNRCYDVFVAILPTAPSFTKGADQLVRKNAPAQTIAKWATNISPGHNEDGQSLAFTVTNDNHALFSVQPSVSPSGTLTFTPAPNAIGTATVTVTLHANKSGTNSGVDTSAPQTFKISICNRYDQTDKRLHYTGKWWAFAHPGSWLGAYWRSAAPGASVSINFTGTRLDWIATIGVTLSKADVYVDGVKKATIDLHRNQVERQQDVFSTGYLSNGKHTVRIVRTPGDPATKFISIDALDIVGTLIS